MSALYDKGREAFLAGDIDWVADTIKVVAVDSGYTPDFAVDDALEDVSGGTRVVTSDALASKTVAAGVADADDVTFTSVTGDPIAGLVVYKEGGSEAASPLIAYIEVGPATPNGSDITVTWDSGANKIFRL